MNSAPTPVAPSLEITPQILTALQQFQNRFHPAQDTLHADGHGIYTRHTEDGVEIIGIPLILQIDVDPLHGFTAAEARQVALDRLADLPLKITLGGVPMTFRTDLQLCEES